MSYICLERRHARALRRGSSDKFCELGLWKVLRCHRSAIRDRPGLFVYAGGWSLLVLAAMSGIWSDDLSRRGEMESKVGMILFPVDDDGDEEDDDKDGDDDVACS